MEDPNIQKIFPAFAAGRSPMADRRRWISRFKMSGSAARGSEFRVDRRGEDLGAFQLNVPGIHNVLNATAALAVGLKWNVGRSKFARGWLSSAVLIAVSRFAAWSAESRWSTITDIIPPK